MGGRGFCAWVRLLCSLSVEIPAAVPHLEQSSCHPLGAIDCWAALAAGYLIVISDAESADVTGAGSGSLEDLAGAL